MAVLAFNQSGKRIVDAGGFEETAFHLLSAWVKERGLDSREVEVLTKEALEAVEKGLKINPNFPGLQQWRNQLKSVMNQ